MRADKFRTTQGPADSRGPFLRPLDILPWLPVVTRAIPCAVNDFFP